MAENGRAVASFVLGMLGILGFLPCIGPILAIALGAGQKDELAWVGVILGGLTLGLYVVVLVGVVVWLFLSHA